ncbi:MAG TPA: ABC transporter ATP-binding protein [Nitratifractor sp.]|nr:ABC transporter ATP-binding protein [Nitratifractor sp.]
MEDAIRVENLVKNFGKGDTFVEIIKEATFSIKKGELVALIAPSGAGKTTLLLMIGCVLSPTSGTIYLGEEKVYDNRWLTKEKRKIRRDKIGFIFQAHYLIPFLNVIENVTLIPETSGVPKKEAEAKALELLEYFGIKEKAKNMPSELSGGQNQRVAIARALANNPQIVLADEPTAALDSKRSVDVVKMLKKIALEENVAVIMVTHDEAMVPLCDRVLTIKDKKVYNLSADEYNS